MKIKLLFLLFLIGTARSAFTQLPQDVYKKPLKEVLTDIEKKYNIKLEYNESLVKGVDVLYPTWRYRVDPEATLSNILMSLDMVFQKKSDKVYTIAKFEYYRKPFEEGKRHLDQLLASYPTVQDWELRKAELRKCFFEQLRLSPLPKKTPLNPIITPKRMMDGYTVENVAIETLPGVYLCGSLYRPAKGKGPFPAVLSPHGHFPSADLNEYGRYRPDQQYRCATLARMGAVACESGLPIHSCTSLGTNNAEIAAMASPRPMLVVSETSDWTQTVPTIEFPYLKKVYNLFGKPENVENVHIENEEHNYGITKRLAMYDFMAHHLGLNIKAVKDKTGKIDESKCTVEKYDAMLVFGNDGKLPVNAVKGPDAIWKVLRSLQ